MTTSENGRTERLVLLVNRWFRYHVVAYLAGNALLYGLNKLTSDYIWSFWPFFFWSLLLACHFFLVRSIRADDRWAEERALQLRAKSYDVDHIRSIERSYRDGTMPGRHDLNLPPEEQETPERR